MKVPTYGEPQVQAQGIPDARVQAGSLAPGFDALSKGVDDLARGIQQFRVSQVETHAKAADVAFGEQANLILQDPDHGLFAQKGQAAVDAYPEALKGLKDAQAEVSKGITDPLARKAFDDASAQRMVGLHGQIMQHVANEGRTAAVAASTARQSLAAADAGQNYLNPTIAEQNIGIIKGEIASRAHLLGSSADEIKLEQMKAVSASRQEIVKRLSQEGNQGPALAAAYAEKYKDDLLPTDMEGAQTYIQSHQNSIDAESRRQDAEARQMLNQVKAQARSQAEAGIARLDLGPIPPDQVASIISAAQQSGDEALIFRVGQAAQRQQTRQVYNNFTPAELQPHVDELSAKVTNAGDRADPADIIQLNTMRDIQQKNASEIKADPLAWGAKHAGIDPGRVNWNDGESIADRLNVAHQVSVRTGYPPTYLTAAEAAQLAPIAASGSAQDKFGLIQKLALFGPTAGTDAARQVAPGDAAFRNLVGLATTPNRSVAQGLVMATLAGPEMKKAYPKLVNRQLMDPAFAQTAGTALRLMPDVAAGVRSNAEDYFAGKMGAAGVGDFLEASGQWPHAIDSALGGYNDHGVKRGGLGTSNGVPTVLPDGVSQAEFDTRIARLSATQLAVASHGKPVYANGSTPKLSDFKSANLVPIAGGYAVLSHGQFIMDERTRHYFIFNFKALH